MEKGVWSMMTLVWFMRLTITMAMNTVTAETISYSMKQYHSSHIREEPHGFYPVMGGIASLQPHEIVLKKDEGNLEDVEALLSFRKALTSDPDGSLLNWTSENSDNVCFWNGIFCRKRTKRVVAMILPGLGLQGIISPSLGSLSLLRILNLSRNNLT